jgi:hypothetical protein
MNNNYTLYYPTIEFRDPRWLWTAALIWDRIYRIVPDGYVPNDSNNIKQLIANSDIISDINPKKYSDRANLKFIDGLQVEGKWWAAALDNSNYIKRDYVQLHKDKADVKIRELLLAEKTKDNDWLNVPHDIASIYMLFLANYIAEQNNICLSTDYSEAWCGSNFFQYDGNICDFDKKDIETSLAAITISDFLPINVMNLTPQDLIKFRENSQYERKRFFQAMRDLSTKISLCEDEKIFADIIADHLKELKDSKKEYNKRMLDIKVTSWYGLKTVMIPALLTVSSAFIDLPKDLVSNLQALGVGLGVIAGFWETQKSISKERKNYECNYLMQLSGRIRNGWHPYDFNNIHEGYQAYLENDLNHFLRD